MLRRGQVPQEVFENKDLTGLFTPLWFEDLRYASYTIMCIARTRLKNGRFFLAFEQWCTINDGLYCVQFQARVSHGCHVFSNPAWICVMFLAQWTRTSMKAVVFYSTAPSTALEAHQLESRVLADGEWRARPTDAPIICTRGATSSFLIPQTRCRGPQYDTSCCLMYYKQGPA